MSFVTVAAATLVVGGLAYGADQQRKAVHSQMDAARENKAKEAKAAVDAESQAAIVANARTAADARRRRSSALTLGDPTASGPATVLGSTVSASKPAAPATVLGGGSRY